MGVTTITAKVLFQLMTDIQLILELQSQRYSILALMPSKQAAEDVAKQLWYAEMQGNFQSLGIYINALAWIIHTCT